MPHVFPRPKLAEMPAGRTRIHAPPGAITRRNRPSDLRCLSANAAHSSLFPITAATFSAVTGRMMPRSVMMAVISGAGVTSNAGL